MSTLPYEIDISNLDEATQEALYIAMIAAEIVVQWTVHGQPAAPDEVADSLEECLIMRADTHTHWPKAYMVAQLTAKLAGIRIPKQEPKYDA
jgi:hypothetical protein